jgi:hypothetical protein
MMTLRFQQSGSPPRFIHRALLLAQKLLHFLPQSTRGTLTLRRTHETTRPQIAILCGAPNGRHDSALELGPLHAGPTIARPFEDRWKLSDNSAALPRSQANGGGENGRAPSSLPKHDHGHGQKGPSS